MAQRVDLSRLTQQEAAELAGVTARALRDWAGVPRNSDGSYSGRALVEWLVARSSTDGEYDNQRERLAAAQAEKVEAENAVRRGWLADTRSVLVAWGDLVAAFRAKVLSIPTKLAPQLTNVSDPKLISDRIRAELYAALAELATGDWVGEPDEPAEAGERPRSAAAGPKRKSVGRRQASTQ